MKNGETLAMIKAVLIKGGSCCDTVMIKNLTTKILQVQQMTSEC